MVNSEMSIPSRVLNAQKRGFANLSLALSASVHTKQFALDENNSGVAFKLTTGVSGLSRRKLFVRAVGDVPEFSFSQPTIYVGDSTLSAGDGYPLYPLDEIELDLDDSVELYAVAVLDTGETAVVSIMEIE